MMGHLIRFIHNRDLAVENIMTAYTRMRLMLGLSVFNPTQGTLSARMQEGGCTLPKASFLLHADKVPINLYIFVFYVYNI
jgi:hypothetical protein